MSKHKKRTSRQKTRPSSPNTVQMSEQQALTNIAQGRDSLTSLKVLVVININKGELATAEEWWQKHEALEIQPDAEFEMLRVKLLIKLGRYKDVLTECARIADLYPDYDEIYFCASHAHYKLHDFQFALNEIEQALNLAPENTQYLFHKATILTDLFRHNEAAPIFDEIIKKEPTNYNYLNNAGNMYRDISDLKQAQALFKQAIPLTKTDTYPYSNYLTTLHYDPDATAEQIYRVCLEWQERFAPKNPPPRPCPADKQYERTLRIGMISDGFQNHPVGKMIIAALEKLPRHAYDFFAYSSNGKSDDITRRFKAISRYEQVSHLSDDQLYKRILEDQIDILIDLSGHNSGTRMRVMAMEPAPVLVKWVGGLINTTGVKAIDYLISDRIETPAGADEFYTEKLIRMPGDYICYETPDYLPDLSPLPANRNGYITLGCFNNPTKINDVILSRWAEIMHELPNSHLFLKGYYYTSEALKARVLATLESLGITADRVRIEGPSSHKDLLACYNEVDIALDPWPYSGGLTTCEAFAMGVPVVTLPGPTFAGRHSATHLVNAGMPELVTHSWDEYRARVIELAADLDSLSTIRSHLRTILLQSPVCDADTFAGHLNNALRAIWQRYCEGKQPEALSFNEQGEVLFADETEPMQLQHPEAPPQPEAQQTFKWEFEGKVITIDHGGQLMNVPVIKQMLDAGTLELIAFDPASHHLKHPLRQSNGVHYYPNVLLGNGKPTTLYACQSASLSGTLKPMPSADNLPKSLADGLKVLAELPINSLALDAVSELPRIDWLVLDDLNNSLDVLEQGSNALKNALLLHADIAFQPTHQRQPNLTEISHWAARQGFRFYCFSDDEHRTPVPQTIIGANRYANELVGATALFIPSKQRLGALSDSQLTKLAFIADTVYRLEGLSYEILGYKSDDSSEHYIQYKTNVHAAVKQPEVPRLESSFKPHALDESTPSANTSFPKQKTKILSQAKNLRVDENTFIHICFNNMHIEPLLSSLSNDVSTGYKNVFLVEHHRSIPNYDVDISKHSNTYYFDFKTDLPRVIELCLEKNTCGIIFHGLFFEWQHKILTSIDNKKKTIWKIWGGDLYNNLNNKKFVKLVDDSVNYVSTILDSESEVFRNSFKPKPILKLQYDFNYSDVEVKPEKNKTVFIGNSGDASNKHIDIIQSLAEKEDAHDFEYFIPYTYNGTQTGLERIKEEIKNSGLKKVTILTEHLSKSEYYEILSHASLYISAHDRQQGLGHIAACFHFGINVVAKDQITVDGRQIKNPVWAQLVDTEGFSIQSFNQFRSISRISNCIRSDWAKKNQEKSALIYKDRVSAESFQKAYLRLEKDGDTFRTPQLSPNRIDKEPKLDILQINQIIKTLQNQRATRESQIPKYSLTLEQTRHCRALTNRKYMLDILPKHAVVAEIGVDEGKFSDQILAITEPHKLHLIDIWGSDRFHDGKYRSICEKLKDKINNGEVVIHKKLSTEASNDFQNSYFDWIYIDTDHSYETTRDELIKYAPKVKENGIICGHDYLMGNWISGYRYGVIEAVHEFCYKYEWELIYVTLDTTESPSFAIRRRQKN